MSANRLVMPQLLLAVVLGALSPLNAARPDPYAIFERAREVLSSQRYPNVVSYTVDVAAVPAEVRQLQHRHYHEYWSAYDDSVVVQPPVSDEQLEHPYKPSPGVNVMGWNVGGPREGTGIKDFIGVPVLAPNFSFGLAKYTPPSQMTSAQLVEQIRREYHDPAPQKVAELERRSGLKTIATITSVARAYRITLVGVEPAVLGPAYHLALQPLEDPHKYRLRDLWIDTATYEIERARVDGNFTDDAMASVAWMVRFRQMGEATYIATESAQSAIVGYHGPMYSSYSVSFSTPQPARVPTFASLRAQSNPLVEP